jgi:uncharacterized membrane protein (UPF0127 family)
MKFVNIQCKGRPDNQAIHAVYCDGFLCRFIGLMFTKSIDPYGGLLMVEKQDSKINTAIHMLFMNYDIAVVWINKDNLVVDVKIAKRWTPVILPESPASLTLELHSDRINDFKKGDLILIDNA